MNVIISNKYKEQLESLEIDVSKKLDGEFEVEEIIDNFSNYFFNKMIIDITSIKNYQTFNTLQKLSINFNIEKIIFLLDSENVNPSFLSQLVSIGIYNFTTTIEGIMYLYNNPNSYRDVVQYQDPSFVMASSTNENNNQNTDSNEKDKNEYKEEKPKNLLLKTTKQHIIGIKNITGSAGATTLTYMLKNLLSEYKDVVAIEVNKKDFIFLRDSDLISVESKDLRGELTKHQNKDIILIDLNSYSEITVCTDILYLIEPTTIKLNKMVMLDRKVFEKLNGKKIVLNQSLLEKKDIASLEFESNSKIYYNIPPLDEKKINTEYLLPLLQKLNLLDGITSDENEEDGKFLGRFKF